MAFFSDFNINKKLGLLALVLGIVAVLIGNPAESKKISADADEISSLGNKSDLIRPADVADWIIQGKIDYLLVDIRPQEEYDKYHIPGALCMGMKSLEKAELPRNEKIILYSEDDATTAQAWLILKGMKYSEVFRLDGGLNAWNEKVMNPDISSQAAMDEQSAFEKTKVIARYFGGKPTMDGKEISDSLSSVEIAKPVQVAAPAVQTTKKKMKKEGC